MINDPSGFTFESAPSAYEDDYSILLSGDTELSGNGSTTTVSGFEFVFGGKTGNERLTIDSGHTLQFQGDYASGTLALTNDGTLVNSGAYYALQLSGNGGNTGTIESNDQARFGLYNSAGGLFTNSGMILVDGVGSGMSLFNGGFSNSGTIEATNGGGVYIDTTGAGETFGNTGTVLADGAGSEVVISGTGFSNSGLGTIQATNGGTIELQNGNFVNNSGLPTIGANSTFSIGTIAGFDNTGATAGSSSTLQPASGADLATQRRHD